MNERSANLYWILGIGLVALVIRATAAYYAYPTPGDASHFVQYAMLVANEGWSAMSDYWSQGMILIGAFAINLGFNPHLMMQGTALVSGIVVVACAAWLTALLGANRPAVILAGLLTATLPMLVHYSAIGLSEMPFMMCALGGFCLLLKGIRLLGRRAWVYLLSGSVCLGLGFYFKGADAAVSLAAFAIYALLFERQALIRQWKPLGIGIVLIIFLIAPLFALTYEKTGHLQAGSKISNLALGRDWNDSKAIYGVDHPWRDRLACLEEAGTWAYLWAYRTELIRRVLLNAADAVRLFNDAVFERTFRMGTGWFFILLVLGTWCLLRHMPLRQYAFPVLCLAVPLSAMALFFFHARLLVPMLPYVLILVSMVLGHVMVDMKRQGRGLLGAIIMAYVATNAFHASALLVKYTPWWSYANQVAVAKELNKYGGDELVITTFGGLMSVYHYTNSPLRTREVQYASIDELEARLNKADSELLIVSDLKRPHWPVSKVFEGPEHFHPNWRLLEELVFADDDWRVPEERWFIIGRGDLLNRLDNEP